MLAAHQIVLAAAQRLLDADTAAGANVNAKNRALTFATYPGLKVYITDDDHQAAANDITWPHEQLHELALVVDCVVQEPDDLEGAMASLVEEVLQALEGSAEASQLSPLQGVRLQSLGSTRSARTDGERATGTASVRFSVTFTTSADDPSTFL